MLLTKPQTCVPDSTVLTLRVCYIHWSRSTWIAACQSRVLISLRPAVRHVEEFSCSLADSLEIRKELFFSWNKMSCCVSWSVSRRGCPAERQKGLIFDGGVFSCDYFMVYFTVWCQSYLNVFRSWVERFWTPCARARVSLFRSIIETCNMEPAQLHREHLSRCSCNSRSMVTPRYFDMYSNYNICHDNMSRPNTWMFRDTVLN